MEKEYKDLKYTKVIKCGKCGQMRLPEESCDCSPSSNEDWEKKLLNELEAGDSMLYSRLAELIRTTRLEAQRELTEEIINYMEDGLDEPTDWYVSVKNFLSSRGLLPKITE